MKSSDDKKLAELTARWNALDLGIDIHGNPVPVRNPPTDAERFLADLVQSPQERLEKLHKAKVDAAFRHWLDVADMHDLTACHYAVTRGSFDKEEWLREHPIKHRREATRPSEGYQNDFEKPPDT
jgi:hypothetical protein